jgi:hypothetical protein
MKGSLSPAGHFTYAPIIGIIRSPHIMDGWHREVNEPTAQRRGRRGYCPGKDLETAS